MDLKEIEFEVATLSTSEYDPIYTLARIIHEFFQQEKLKAEIPRDINSFIRERDYRAVIEDMTQRGIAVEKVNRAHITRAVDLLSAMDYHGLKEEDDVRDYATLKTGVYGIPVSVGNCICLILGIRHGEETIPLNPFILERQVKYHNAERNSLLEDTMFMEDVEYDGSRSGILGMKLRENADEAVPERMLYADLLEKEQSV